MGTSNRRTGQTLLFWADSSSSLTYAQLEAAQRAAIAGHADVAERDVCVGKTSPNGPLDVAPKFPSTKRVASAALVNSLARQVPCVVNRRAYA
jgi:hypothetical protein